MLEPNIGFQCECKHIVLVSICCCILLSFQFDLQHDHFQKKLFVPFDSDTMVKKVC